MKVQVTIICGIGIVGIVGTDMPVIITRNIIYAYLTYDSNLYPTFICFE